MPLFFSLRMLRERHATLVRWPIEIAGLPLLAASYCALPDRLSSGPTIVTIRWTLLLAALHFFAAVSPFVGRADQNGFWQFNRRLFLRFCLTTLNTAVLSGGTGTGAGSARTNCSACRSRRVTSTSSSSSSVAFTRHFSSPGCRAILPRSRRIPNTRAASGVHSVCPGSLGRRLYGDSLRLRRENRAHPRLAAWLGRTAGRLVLSGVGILAALRLHVRCECARRRSGRAGSAAFFLSRSPHFPRCCFSLSANASSPMV